MRRYAKDSQLELRPDSDAAKFFAGPKREVGAPLDGAAVLIVDDTPFELERFAAWLALLGADVTCARTLGGGSEALGTRTFHAVVLDRLLPDGNCFDLLEALSPPCAVVVASGYIDAETWNMIEGRGAVPAPKSQLRSPLLLMGFVEEALRRAGIRVQPATDVRERLEPQSISPVEEATDPQSERWVIARGPVAIDVRRRSVTVLGEERRLQPKQFDVLVHLMLKPEQLVTEEELLRTVWSDTGNVQSASMVRSTMSRLRSGLGLPGDAFIQTAPGGWGIGIWPVLKDAARHKNPSDE